MRPTPVSLPFGALTVVEASTSHQGHFTGCQAALVRRYVREPLLPMFITHEIFLAWRFPAVN